MLGADDWTDEEDDFDGDFDDVDDFDEEDFGWGDALLPPPLPNFNEGQPGHPPIVLSDSDADEVPHPLPPTYLVPDLSHGDLGILPGGGQPEKIVH